MVTIVSIVLSVVFLFVYVNAVTPDVDHLSPILIIPGHSGSVLNIQDSSNTDCNTNGKTFRIWVNITALAATPDCFVIQMELNYSNSYSDAQDVSITTANFGNSSSVEILDLTDQQPYFHSFVEYFVQRGYIRNVNIWAASYDWRLATEQLMKRGYFSPLKQLIQTMYEENDNTKVTLVVHSMGGPVSLYFLNRFVDQQWKDTYIHNYITLAGARNSGGVRTLISGPTSNPFIRIDFRSLYRTMPSFYYLLPHARFFNNTVIATTSTMNYTASDYVRLFTDAGYPQGYTQYSETDLEFAPPNVSTYCFYSLGHPTPLKFDYGDGFPDTAPVIINGEEDNTVNQESSEVCLQWANSGYPFNGTVFQGSDHISLVSDETVLKTIESIIKVPSDGALSLVTLYQLLLMTLVSTISSIIFG